MSAIAKLTDVLLSNIPAYPKLISTTELVQRVRSAGLQRTERAIQRALQELSTVHPIQANTESKPFQWRWMEGAFLEYPPMPPHVALSLTMAEQYLSRALPKAAVGALRERAKRAAKTLNASKKYSGWLKKVYVLPKGFQLQPPAIEPQVLNVVYEALLEGRQLKVEYRKRGREAYKLFDVNPIALVVRGSLVSLVSTRAGTDCIQQLHLHRMRSPEPVNQKSYVPRGVDIQQHIREGNVDYKLSPEPISLELLVSQIVVDTLVETPLSKDQTLEAGADERFRVRATVPDTIELRGWIKSYGPHIEVVAPANVRKEIARELREAAERYA